eukprot:TRINITY_DN7918_c0_g1_i1.p1 TRINITY_DN7918_c0_g1~~TRINITY_DN7918_c0_g1_i1.p1  ORF type:complete len:355 (-),score=56.56 TRINITY_DN7918_c0_g1_i1:9-1073(-)
MASETPAGSSTTPQSNKTTNSESSTKPTTNQWSTLTASTKGWTDTVANSTLVNKYWTSNLAIKTLMAGGIAGAVSRTTVAPLERLKIIYQVQAQSPGHAPKYTGIIHSLKIIWQEEGLKGYFKGNGVNCVRIFPTSAIQFFSYESYKRKLPLREGNKELTHLQRLLAGGSAGITALVATYPLDFIRARLSIQTDNRYRGILHGLACVVREEGPLALYRGIWPSVLGVVPYVGIDLALYDSLKRYVSRFNDDGKPTTLQILCCGAFAGSVAQTVAYPLDLIRRRLQVQEFMRDRLDPAQRYKGTTDAFVKIYRAEGLVGYFRGLWPNYIKVVPSISVTFLIFENLKLLFDIPNTK